MSTDDGMDAMLHDAGNRWRAANPASASTVDFDAATPVAQSSPRRNWLLISSAAVIVAAIAVGATWLGTRGDTDGSSTHQVVGGAQSTPVADGGPVAQGGLVGPTWKIFDVTTTTTRGSDGLDASDSTASLTFNADGTFTGSDGCNSLSGAASITSSSITFTDVASTAMGCLDDNVTKLDGPIDAILQGTVEYSIGDAGVGYDLSIVHDGVGSLIYFADKGTTAPPVQDPAKMVGTWGLTQYEQSSADNGSGSGGTASGSGGSAGSSAGAPSGLGDTLTVDADGTFTIQHRCYADAGKVEIGKGTATWSDVHPDGSIPCPAIADQKDEQMLDALVDQILSGSTTWAIDGSGLLTITRDSGNDLGFSPAPSSTPSGSPTK